MLKVRTSVGNLQRRPGRCRSRTLGPPAVSPAGLTTPTFLMVSAQQVGQDAVATAVAEIAQFAMQPTPAQLRKRHQPLAQIGGSKARSWDIRGWRGP